VIPPDPERHRVELTEKLSALQAKAGDEPVESRLVLAADPAEEILRVAQKTPCLLVVMGTPGRTGLARLLMDSVAD
jgi:nucleotide-binding universal stress UspA family protein